MKSYSDIQNHYKRIKLKKTKFKSADKESILIKLYFKATNQVVFFALSLFKCQKISSFQIKIGIFILGSCNYIFLVNEMVMTIYLFFVVKLRGFSILCNR